MEVGDLIAVALTMSEEMSRPFAIGRVLRKRDEDDYLIHWYGSTSRKLEGTYRPEWVVKDGEGETTSYFSQTKKGEVGTQAFTSELAGQVIQRHNILHFGFQLVFDDKLPIELKRLMHENVDIAWAIPRK